MATAPKVSLKLDLDISKFSADLASAKANMSNLAHHNSNVMSSSFLRIQQDKMRTDAKIMELDRKMLQVKEQLATKEVQDNKNKNNKLLEQERELARQKESILSNFHLRERQLVERTALQQLNLGKTGTSGGFNMSAAGHLAQMAGFYKTGHLLRAAGMLGIGTSVGGEGAMAGMSGIAAIALPVAAGLGAVLVASKLVEVGFNAVAQTVQSVIGAISQIGGVRNLQEMLVETASTERQAANIASNVTDQVSTKEVLDLINKTSASTEFKPEEVGSGFQAFKGKTGQFGPLKELAPFMANLSTVSGMSMQESGGLLGQIMTQFPELGVEGTQQAAMNLWGLGRAGAVELKDATSITQALGFAHKSGMGTEKGLNFEMGMVQLAQRFTGGQSAKEAVTGVRRVQEDLLKVGSKNQNGLQQLLGKDYLTHDATGQLVFKDEAHSMAQLALMNYEGGGNDKKKQALLASSIDERGRKALMGIGTSFAKDFKPGMSETQKLGIIEDMFRGLADGTVAVDEFDGELKKNTDTIDYQFKAAINKASISLEKEFLPILQNLIPVVQSFSDDLVDHSKDIGDALQKVINVAIGLAEVFPTLITAVGAVVSWAFSLLPERGTDKAIAYDDKNVRKDKDELKRLESIPKNKRGLLHDFEVQQQKNLLEQDQRALALDLAIKHGRTAIDTASAGINTKTDKDVENIYASMIHDKATANTEGAGGPSSDEMKTAKDEIKAHFDQVHQYQMEHGVGDTPEFRQFLTDMNKGFTIAPNQTIELGPATINALKDTIPNAPTDNRTPTHTNPDGTQG